MKLFTETIQLACSALGERPIKRGALALFRAARTVSSRAKETPSVLTQVVKDVREAWQEASQETKKDRPC